MTNFLLSLVRHGETEANREKIIQGQRDMPLSSVGRTQAAKLGARLTGETLTCVYSSDLIRARETADIILGSNSSGASVIVDQRLRERHFGDAQGKPLFELVNAARRHHLSPVQYTPPNGEKLEHLQQRAKEFFLDLCKAEAKRETSGTFSSPLLEQHADKLTRLGTVTGHVLVATHGGVVRALLEYFERQFDCKLPGDASVTTPNTGLSSFVVSLNGDKCSSMLCLWLHDKGHL